MALNEAPKYLLYKKPPYLNALLFILIEHVIACYEGSSGIGSHCGLVVERFHRRCLDVGRIVQVLLHIVFTLRRLVAVNVGYIRANGVPLQFGKYRLNFTFKDVINMYGYLLHYSPSRPIACHRQEPETVSAGSSHSQQRIFLFHGNCTSQSHGTASSHKVGGLVNRAVKMYETYFERYYFSNLLLHWVVLHLPKLNILIDVHTDHYNFLKVL